MSMEEPRRGWVTWGAACREEAAQASFSAISREENPPFPSWHWVLLGLCPPGWTQQVAIFTMKWESPVLGCLGQEVETPSLPFLDTLMDKAGFDGGHGEASLS